MVTAKNPRVMNFNHVPNAIRDVLHKATEEIVEDRFQSVIDFRDALRGHRVVISVYDFNEGECPGCLTKNDPTRKFCKKCADSLLALCLSCSESIRVWEEVCDHCGKKQSLFIAKLKEGMLATQLEAEDLLSNYDFDKALTLATQLKDHSDPRLRQFKPWSEQFPRKIEADRTKAYEYLSALIAEALRYEYAYEYNAALEVLEKVHSNLRNFVISDLNVSTNKILMRVQAEIRYLNERRSKMEKVNTEVESLIKEFGFDYALHILKPFANDSDPRLTDLKKQSQSLVDKVELHRGEAYQRVSSLMTEVLAFEELHDYESALRFMENVPQKLRSMVTLGSTVTVEEIKRRIEKQLDYYTNKRNRIQSELKRAEQLLEDLQFRAALDILKPIFNENDPRLIDLKMVSERLIAKLEAERDEILNMMWSILNKAEKLIVAEQSCKALNELELIPVRVVRSVCKKNYCISDDSSSDSDFELKDEDFFGLPILDSKSGKRIYYKIKSLSIDEILNAYNTIADELNQSGVQADLEMIVVVMTGLILITVLRINELVSGCISRGEFEIASRTVLEHETFVTARHDILLYNSSSRFLKKSILDVMKSSQDWFRRLKDRLFLIEIEETELYYSLIKCFSHDMPSPLFNKDSSHAKESVKQFASNHPNRLNESILVKAIDSNHSELLKTESLLLKLNAITKFLWSNHNRAISELSSLKKDYLYCKQDLLCRSIYQSLLFIVTQRPSILNSLRILKNSKAKDLLNDIGEDDLSNLKYMMFMYGNACGTINTIDDQIRDELLAINKSYNKLDLSKSSNKSIISMFTNKNKQVDIVELDKLRCGIADLYYLDRLYCFICEDTLSEWLTAQTTVSEIESLCKNQFNLELFEQDWTRLKLQVLNNKDTSLCFFSSGAGLKGFRQPLVSGIAILKDNVVIDALQLPNLINSTNPISMVNALVYLDKLFSTDTPVERRFDFSMFLTTLCLKNIKRLPQEMILLFDQIGIKRVECPDVFLWNDEKVAKAFAVGIQLLHFSDLKNSNLPFLSNETDLSRLGNSELSMNDCFVFAPGPIVLPGSTNFSISSYINSRGPIGKRVSNKSDYMSLPSILSSISLRYRLLYMSDESSFLRYVFYSLSALAFDTDRVFDDSIGNNLAWDLCVLPSRNYNYDVLAFNLALNACIESDFRRSSHIDTLAATCANLGDYQSAIFLQQICINLASSDKVERYKTCLDRYQVLSSQDMYGDEWDMIDRGSYADYD